MGVTPCFLPDSDFEGCGLRRNTVRHEVCVTDPDTHTRSKPVKIKRSSETVKNKGVIRYIKTDNGKGISVADGGKTAVLAVNL